MVVALAYADNFASSLEQRSTLLNAPTCTAGAGSSTQTLLADKLSRFIESSGQLFMAFCETIVDVRR